MIYFFIFITLFEYTTPPLVLSTDFFGNSISKLDGSSTPITATLDNDICWTSSNPSDNPFKEGVQAIRDEYSIPSPDPAYAPVSLNDVTFDGNGKTIKNLEVTKADGNGNAGVFGTLDGENSIEKLKLENVSVTAPDAKEAGALIGHSEGNLTVQRVESHTSGSITATDYAGGLIGYAEGDVSVIASASYSEKGATSAGDGSPGNVTATGRDGVDGVAGGLIGGLVDKNGNATAAKVEGCAAANVVTANGEDSYAGGLIGQTGGTVDVNLSYAGGVTKDDDPASVTGAYAGGLIGHSDGPGVTIEKSYSSATADGSEKTGGLYTGDANVEDPTVSYGADNLKSHKDSDRSTPGMPYDADLLNEEYPYRTIGNIIAEEGAGNLPEWLDDGIPAWITNHVGDWPPSNGASLPAVIWGADGVESVSTEDGKFYTVANDDVRYAWIDLSECDLENQRYITLSVSNLQSGDKEVKDTTTLYSFRVEEDGNGGADVTPQQSGSPNATYETIGPDGTADGGPWLRVTLDDIASEGQRFRDLFPDLNPAEEIRIHAKASQNASLAVDDLLNDDTKAERWYGDDKDAPKPNIASPLYDIVVPNDVAQAGVSSIRHLQNLDASVSGVGDEITSAKLLKDLDWKDNDWNDKKIYIGDADDGYYATSFYGITNENLTSFDGQGYCLGE